MVQAVVVSSGEGVEAYTHYRNRGEYFLVDSFGLMQRN